MLSILGLLGLTLSAFVMVGPMFEAEDADDGNTAPEPENDGAADMLSDEYLGASDAGQTDQGFLSNSGETGLTGDDAINVIFGTAGGEALSGLGGDDYLSGEDGDDTLSGGDGADELHGGRGNDALHGDAGDDIMFGHTGDDTMMGDEGADNMDGGDGADRLYGGAGDDRMSGNLGDDTLFGGAGADTLFGGLGSDSVDGRGDGEADFLNGGAGDDTLFLGAGDIANGGDGADTFQIDAGAGGMISDFDPDQDRVEVAYDADGDIPQISYSEGDQGVTLLADGQEVVTFAGLTALDMDGVPVVFLPA